MSLCPESERRRSMPDAEFWAEVAEHILGAPGGGDDEPEIDPEVQRDPCPECGETGACAWDSEGRALIHATDAEDDR